MRAATLCAALGGALVACASPAPVDVAPGSRDAGAGEHVTACVESVKDGVARVRIENRAGVVVSVPGVVFVSAPLLLEVRDAKGEPAPLGPPPLPGGPITSVGPTDAFTTEASLPSDLPRGRYTVKARTAGHIRNVCDALSYEVR